MTLRPASCGTTNLVHSMSRRGNCQDNAVAERFFNLFKRVRTRRRTYRTRDEKCQEVFDYIEMFYNRPASTSATACYRPSNSRNGTRSSPEFVYRKLGYFIPNSTSEKRRVTLPCLSYQAPG
jgi:hypothetical protein